MRQQPMEIVRKHFQTIDSTNTWAKHNAHLFELEKITLVTADEQTGGRGRFKRTWESPPLQNIYASFCFGIEKHRSDIGNLPQIMALSAAVTLERLGFSPKLKWPNDVLLSGKKVAGILSETTPLSDQLWMIVGIGLNVNMPEELLRKIDRPATSMLAESKKEWSVEAVLAELQNHFAHDLERFLEDGFHPFLEDYKTRIIHNQGDRIRFHDNMAVREGFFDSINKDGTLLMKLESGELRTFVSGEILP